MRRTIISTLLIILIAGVSGCAKIPDADQQAELSQRLESLENKIQTYETNMSEISQRVEAIEKQFSVSEETSAVVEDQSSDSTKMVDVDYLAHSKIEEIFSFLPAEFLHPLPKDRIEKVIIFKDENNERICLLYNQVITTQELELMANNLSSEVKDDLDTFGGSTGWKIETDSATYAIQLVEPEKWYNGYLETKTKSTAVFIMIPTTSAPNLSYWFNADLQAYDDYQLPSVLSDNQSEVGVILGTVDNDGAPVVITVMTWKNLSAENVNTVINQYRENLKDLEWFSSEGDANQFANVFAKLDKNRSIYIKTQIEGDSSYTCQIQIAHFDGANEEQSLFDKNN